MENVYFTGEEKVITKRGVKYPECIKNASKSATSIMFCGNAEGEVMPPYVCYKASRMHLEWCLDGPPGTRYNRSDSGWFDSTSFSDWFFSLALPELKKKEDWKALIGDNLSSHINIEVLRACEAHKIKFIPLPANATHLLQPLDVAYFRPMKIAWRKILDNFKTTEAGGKNIVTPKTIFPGLLKELTDNLKLKDVSNLQGGFRKSGIYPINKSEPIKRLCKSQLSDMDFGCNAEKLLKCP